MSKTVVLIEFKYLVYLITFYFENIDSLMNTYFVT